MSQAFTLSISSDGIGELKFDLKDEKVNTFSLSVLNELERILDSLETNTQIQVLKLTSGKSGQFIAGADLHSFEPAFVDSSKVGPIIQTGHRVFAKLARLPFPTVAVINGICVGGGCECVLSCTYRVATDNPKTQIGLPEVNLGIFPGWGGTQRLPRLIGFSEGLGMVLSGKVISAFKAWKLHLVDALIPDEFQEEKVKDFISLILTKEGAKKIQKKRQEKPFLQKLLDNNPVGRALASWQARKQLMEKTKGHYPAPLIALDLMKRSYALSLEEGLKEEGNTFIANVPHGFIHAPSLIALFFTQEALKKEGPKVAATPITTAAVLGAGTMGAGIAWLFASHQILTRLKDISWEVIGHGMGVIYAQFKKGIKAKKIAPWQVDRSFQLISGTTDYSGFQKAEIVLEAATENLDLKKKIFQEIELAIPKHAIIASNTSSLSIDVMAESLQYPERFIGMHFFNPVPKMPLVEIVPGKKTSQETLATAVEFCRKLGKTPIIVGDCPGFLVNRILITGANEMMLMLEEGYTVESLDKAVLDFGMPMGPLVLSDEIGNDVIYKVACIFEKAYGERMRPAQILHLMFEKGFLGKKTGKGFFLYKNKHVTRNPEAFKLIQSVGKKSSHLPANEILPRFLYAMINEASRCLEEKIIERPDYLDMALIMGVGFPPFQGGLLRYADRVGVKNIVDSLKAFEKAYGSRFTPSVHLLEMAENNRSFYS